MERMGLIGLFIAREPPRTSVGFRAAALLSRRGDVPGAYHGCATDVAEDTHKLRPAGTPSQRDFA